MGQIRVPKDVWEKLDEKAKEARKVVENGVFLNEPVLDETTQEYVWDDHRLTEDHDFIMEEVKKLKPVKADTREKLIEKLEEKVYLAKAERIKPMPSPILGEPVGDIRVDEPLQSKPDAQSTPLTDTKEPLMGVLAIGNDQNFTRPSDVGNNDPFPGFDHTRNAVRRLAENRIAGVANKTIDFEPTWNDVLVAHRAVFDSEFTKPSKLFAALDPSRYIGLSQELSAAQGTAFVDARAGVTWTFSANANGVAEAFVPTANGQVVVASAGADNIFAQTLAVQDPGLTAGNWIAINYTDANNHLRVYRQSATNVRVERVVSGTPTTELDTTVVAATDPVAGSALGIRRTGTACSVFLNGRRIANFTLSATAQGFAGTGVAFQTVTGGRTLNGPMEIHNNLNL